MSQPSKEEMACVHCGRFGKTKLECKFRKDGRVEFQVHCDACGNWSHTLPRGILERAIESRLLTQALKT